MVCGISSSLTQVTVVPAVTVSVGGEKVKLSTRTSAALVIGAAVAGVCARGSVGSARPPATSARPPAMSARDATWARTRVNSFDMTQSLLWVAGLGWVRAAVASPDRTVSGDQGRIDDGEGLATLDEVDRRHAQVLPQLARRDLHGPR